MEKELLLACKEILTKNDLEVSDKILKSLEEEGLKVEFYQKNLAPYLKIYSTKKRIISQIFPILHDTGLIIIDDISYDITIDNKKIYIYRFLLQNNPLEIKNREKNLTNILELAISQKILPRCPLYSLALKENLSSKEITLLRALIKYENQLVVEFNQNSIINTFLNHSCSAKSLVELFIAKFDPTIKNRKNIIKNIEEKIEECFKKVDNITEDKIIRILYQIIQSTTRTNFFLNKETISFKVDISNLEDFLLGIQPKLEIYVYHRFFNGVHLRMSKISRGGIRWSDRFDDFREEIKSLMSTQEAKNAIIVPSGAKGGFVIYKDKLSFNEFKNYYTLFIDALLDLIDNPNQSKDKRVISYDDNDFYFVVAADKGTASMSDIANSIAINKNFWLYDAFASGGSSGYSHKELGVTAKGAWKSVARFFIEKGIDIYKDKISVVGIGSMRGDVFGNGMLINPNILLLAAISHSEIFIDPNPDPEVAYKERLRLFRENKNWSEYNKNLISKGGGVFKRNQRNIELTPQIQKLLKTKKVSMSGEELAKRVLMTNVDLLYFGGVGTYVKSSEELNIYIGDKENEGVRINANDLRCFAVCEGGNLGFTQKARIEYAKNGGKINLDSIDNSAGVDTSDHEVNLKIVLNSLKKKGVINEEERIKTLKNLTDKVLNSVFWTNYHQSLAISLDEIRSSKNLSNFIKSIEVLENSIKIFKRRDFDIPKPADFETILTKDNTIVRPILGILLSYSKILIKQVLLNSQFLDTPLAQHYFFKYFPKSFVSLYEKEVNLHPLKREITATVIANYIINNTGSSFIVDFEELKEEGFIKKIESYLIMNRLLDTNDIRYEIYRNDFLIDTKKQYQLLLSLEEMIDFSVRWMIKKENKIDPILLLSYKQELKELLIKAKKRVNIINITPIQEINIFFSFQEYLKFTAAAIDIKQKTTLSFSKVAKLFFLIIDRFKINELLDAIKEYKPISKNEHLVKKELEELVEYFVVKMGIKNLKYSSFSEDIEEHFKNFLENNYKHYQKVLDEIKEFEDKKNPTLALLSHLVNSLVLSIIY